MAELSHREAERIAAATRAGRSSQRDRERLEAHLEGCLQCAERFAILDDFFRGLSSEPMPASESGDRALVARAVMQAGAAGSWRPPAARSVVRWLAAAAVLLAGSGGIAWWLAAEPAEPIAGASTAGSVAEADADRPVEPESGRRVVTTGAAGSCAGIVLHTGADASLERTVTSGRQCEWVLTTGEIRMAVDPDANIEVAIRTPVATVRVIGTVFLVRTTGGERAVVAVHRGEVHVETASAKVRVRDDERLIVDGSGSSTVEALRPEERARLATLEPDGGAAPHPDPASGEPDAGTPDPDAPSPGGEARAPEHHSARERPSARKQDRKERPERETGVSDLRRMLRSGRTAEARRRAEERSRRPEYERGREELLTIVAESYAVEGDYARAMEAYRLVVESPRSTTAANALLASARLALERLDRPAEALELYERFLDDYPESPLRQTAEVGRCRAQAAAGRPDTAATCARDYLSAYPDGRLRRQAERLLR